MNIPKGKAFRFILSCFFHFAYSITGVYLEYVFAIRQGEGKVTQLKYPSGRDGAQSLLFASAIFNPSQKFSGGLRGRPGLALALEPQGYPNAFVYPSLPLPGPLGQFTEQNKLVIL